jgi:hypothetical protein
LCSVTLDHRQLLQERKQLPDSVRYLWSYPSRDAGIALAVAGAPAEAGEDDDEGDEIEDRRDDCEDQLYLQERERQPYLGQ